MRKDKLRSARLSNGQAKEPIGRRTRSPVELMDSSKPPLERAALAFPGKHPGAIPSELDGPVLDTRSGSRWHSRGYLPHFGSRTVIQFVTFHLADSLPNGVLDKLSQEIKRLPLERQEAEKRKRVEAWIDAGHGDCALRETDTAEAVQDALLCFDGQRYRMLAWVVMPNHVHALFQSLQGWTVAKIVESWKKFTARKILEHRRNRNAYPGNAPGNANLLIDHEKEPIERWTRSPAELMDSSKPPLEIAALAFPAALTPSSAGAAGVWHREYWDRYIRDENHYQQTLVYIHQNPVKAGLVARAEDWRWSSAASGFS